MQAPSPSASGPTGASSASSAPAAPTATEIVKRPDPGIARGKWEAPVWIFWVALGVVVVAATVYLLRRLGMLRFGKKKA